MPRPRTGNPVGRPFTYTTDEERPTSVSVRIPHDLHAQAKRDVRLRHPMTLTELLLDGLRLRLETPADPRDIILSDDNTVIRELQDMIRAAVQAEMSKLSSAMMPHFKPAELIPAPESPAEPICGSHLGEAATHGEGSSYYDNTVLQEKASKPRGRRSSTTRQQILVLLQEHPEGLSPEQIRAYLSPEKPIGDVLQGMRRSGVVHLRGDGYQKRYFVA